MGQRHQIYAAFLDQNNKTKVIGLHHQWLWGQPALLLARNFLRLFSIKQYMKLSDLMFIAYSADPENLYLSTSVTPLDESKGLNPNNFDNNNGITIFDLRDEKNPKYCFMWLHNDLECLDQDLKTPPLPLTPFSAEEWASMHYLDFKDRKRDKMPRVFSRKTYKSILCSTIHEFQKHFHVTDKSKSLEEEYEAAIIKTRKFRKLTRDLVDEMKSYKVLTADEVFELLPDLKIPPST